MLVISERNLMQCTSGRQSSFDFKANLITIIVNDLHMWTVGLIIPITI